MRKFTLLTMCCLPLLLLGQSFIEIAEEQGIIHQYMGGQYGGGASFYDVNKDGWDDLTLTNDGSDIVLYLNEQGTFTGPFSVAENTGQAKSVTWVDYDNDGDADLLVTRMNGPWTLYRNDGDVLNMTDVTEEAGLPITSHLTYGASWADIDRDGDLDLYICNYNGDGITNYMFENNGDGTFTDISAECGADDGSWYSFQGLFMDYNHDLWPDLFVVNDRLPATNNMYRNDEGSFTQVTEELGLEDYFFSMNASTSDFDHDGDMDLYVSNNPFGNRFYTQNEDLSYTNSASSTGVEVLDHSWSAQWIDYDNDTFEDLHVCCSPFWGQPGQNRFFKNNGNGTFSLNIFNGGFNTDQGWSHTSVAGDFNNDGFFDLFVVNDFPDVSKLWKCNPNDNHYIKVTLEGVVSNRDGIGTWIEVWSNGVKQIRYTHCGEGYLTQNSQSEIFGMAQANKADSMILSWPSGQVDKYYELFVNANYQLIEGGNLLGGISSSQGEICQGDSILLTALDGINHVWNTGASDIEEIWVYEPGIYSYTAENDLGITFNSEQIIIVPGNLPDVSFEVSNPSCDGINDGVLSIVSNIPSESYIIEINGESTDWSTENLAPGDYHIVISDEQGCVTDSIIHITSPDPLFATWNTQDILCAGGTAAVQLTLSGGTGALGVDWGSLNPDALPSGSHPFTLSDANGCAVSYTVDISEPQQLTATAEVVNEEMGGDGAVNTSIEGGTPPYTVEWNGPNNFTSAQMNLTNLESGIYTALIYDSNDCLITMSAVVLPVGVNDEEALRYSIFPNPSGGVFTISGWRDGEIDLVVTTTSGRQVVKNTTMILSGRCQLDLSDLAAGSYILHITQNGHRKSEQLLIAH